MALAKAWSSWKKTGLARNSSQGLIREHEISWKTWQYFSSWHAWFLRKCDSSGLRRIGSIWHFRNYCWKRQTEEISLKKSFDLPMTVFLNIGFPSKTQFWIVWVCLEITIGEFYDAEAPLLIESSFPLIAYDGIAWWTSDSWFCEV